MREIAASRLVGMGIEVGPGASPFPIPLHCDVLYADRLSGSELVKELYRGQLREDLIEPDLLADLENPADIAESSVDFIVACHVIEHSRNPIGALAECWRRLKPRGQLVLVVPDMRKTFDRKRATTPLAHFILDFTEPSRERDRQHYEEFYRLAFETAPDKLASTVEAKYQEQYAIHYHTWTYESFGEMVSWVGQSTAPFSEVWSQPTRSDPQQDIEFYFVLTK
jgi:SAM-dependent methyltransferase